jgi:UDP-2,3-diacylglucosamine pyrophosphatase LpxH
VNHTVVISDVHLCQDIPGDDVWMRYRQPRFSPDADFAQLFARIRREARGETLSVVFNGDVFDFDAAPVLDGVVRDDQPTPTEHEASDVLARILADHPRFVDGLADLVADGHTVVFVSGNHDAQLGWTRVRATLAGAIVTSARARHTASDENAWRSRIVFRTWFHRTPDAIHVEHGHQYDHYCSFRHPMQPFTSDGRIVQPTMGSLSFRHLVSRMGYFNPHVDSSFMLSAREYIAHWARYYARSPHSLATTWARGAVKIMRELFAHRVPGESESIELNIDRSSAETGATPSALRRHASLFATPVNEHAHSAIRELWLDRVAMGGAGILAVGAAALAGPVALTTAAVGSAGAIAAYEMLTPKPSLDETYTHTASCQREIAKIHGARAVVLGHTHQAFARWERGVFHGNCGTWSAAFRDAECTQPATDGRPLVWLRTRAGEMSGGLYYWHGDRTDLTEAVSERG